MLKLNVSALSVSALDKEVAKTKLIGPNGDIQFKVAPVEDLSLLLSFKVLS